MSKRPISIGARTIVPVEHLRNPEGALIDFTIENGAWTQGADPEKIPRYFAEAHPIVGLDDEMTAISFPRAANLKPWLKPGLQAPVYAEYLDADLWPRVELGTRTPELGPNKFIQYDQGPAWEAIAKEPLRWPGGRILVLKCGGGKTALSLRLAQFRARRTIVVCHTWNMCKQWANEAKSLLGVEPDQIGFIGDGNVEWRRDLVFTTMPGLLCREYPDEIWYRFGLTIFDEGDLLGASQMRQILDKFYGERLLVTATIDRADGNQTLFYFHVGEVCFRDTEDDIVPEVIVLESPVPEFIPVEKKGLKPAQQTIYNRARRQHQAHIPKTVSLLAEYQPRRDWCLEVVHKLLKEGRKILFIGTRVADLKWFHARAGSLFEAHTSGIILGKNRGIDEEEAARALRDSDVTWGIHQLAKRGMNERSLDTVVLQFSQFNEPGAIRQFVGRVCRYHPDKKSPLVVLLNDRKVPCLDSNTYKIVEQLRQRGSEVTWYDE